MLKFPWEYVGFVPADIDTLLDGSTHESITIDQINELLTADDIVQVNEKVTGIGSAGEVTNPPSVNDMELQPGSDHTKRGTLYIYTHFSLLTSLLLLLLLS